MKKNLTTTQNTDLILKKSKSTLGITKRILSGKTMISKKNKPFPVLYLDTVVINKLMWERKSQMMDWKEAMKYAKNLTLGGYYDWRLPTLEELEEVVLSCGGTLSRSSDENWRSITDNDYYQSMYKKIDFTSNYYWSSTDCNSYSALGIYFYGGYSYCYYKADSYYVRCVRKSI